MSAIGYRPEIDGLRAVAVVLVVLFHAGLGCPGGFVGVDVFFVISGYLVTSILLKRIDADTFSLRDFWMRRLRRIAPALIAVVITTVTVASTFMLPYDFEQLCQSAVHQAFAASNFGFCGDSEYFGRASDTKALLHTWSLAVEEQFYILMPLLAMWLASRSRHAFGIALVSVGALSFVGSVIEVRLSPTSAFFLLPSRAWELVAGALIAVAPVHLFRFRRSVGELASALGLGLIAAAATLYSNETLFPGESALAPVVGAALFIMANTHRSTFTARLLSSKLPVGIGLISYSLYLWHWPIFALTRYWTESISAELGVTLVAISSAAAWLSWRFIETPFRTNTFNWTDGGYFARIVAVQTAIVAIGLFVDATEGTRQRLPDRVQPLVEQNLWAMVDDADVAAGRLRPLGDAAASRPSFLLIGDSHAMAYAGVFDELAHRSGRRGFVAAANQPYGSLIGPISDDVPGNSDRLSRRNADLVRFVQTNGISAVFAAQRWEMTYAHHDPDRNGSVEAGDTDTIDAQLPKLLRAFSNAGATVVLLDQVPRQPGGDGMNADLFRNLMLRKYHIDQEPLTISRFRQQAWWRPYLERHAAAGRAQVLNISTECFDNDGRSIVFDGENPCYYDDDHLTNHGATTLIGPLLTGVFQNSDLFSGRVDSLTRTGLPDAGHSATREADAIGPSSKAPSDAIIPVNFAEAPPIAPRAVNATAVGPTTTQ